MKENVINLEHLWISDVVKKQLPGTWKEGDYVQIIGTRTKDSKTKVVFRIKLSEFFDVISRTKYEIVAVQKAANKNTELFNDAVS